MSAQVWNAEKLILWKQLNDFTIGSNKEYNGTLRNSFTARLARENNWSYSKAKKGVEEYKKFVFLCKVEGNCSPSEEIDQVWHLHLLYTKSYWNELCKCILQTPLHHIPSTGGQQQLTHHVNQYQRTSELYKLYFGEGNREFWPELEQYLSKEIRHYNASDYFLIRKSSLLLFAFLFAFLFALFILSNLATYYYTLQSLSTQSVDDNYNINNINKNLFHLPNHIDNNNNNELHISKVKIDNLHSPSSSFNLSSLNLTMFGGVTGLATIASIAIVLIIVIIVVTSAYPTKDSPTVDSKETLMKIEEFRKEYGETSDASPLITKDKKKRFCIRFKATKLAWVPVVIATFFYILYFVLGFFLGIFYFVLLLIPALFLISAPFIYGGIACFLGENVYFGGCGSQYVDGGGGDSSHHNNHHHHHHDDHSHFSDRGCGADDGGGCGGGD